MGGMPQIGKVKNELIPANENFFPFYENVKNILDFQYYFNCLMDRKIQHENMFHLSDGLENTALAAVQCCLFVC